MGPGARAGHCLAGAVLSDDSRIFARRYAARRGIRRRRLGPQVDEARRPARLTALRAARIVYLQLGEVDHALRAWTAYILIYGDTAGLRPCFGAGPEADRPRMATGPGGSRAVGKGSHP